MAEIKQVLVPDIGDYKDVDIIEVMVKTGDTIKAEDNLVTLETDKAAMDVPSPYSGVVKEVKVKVGDKVSEGSLILLLESGDTASAPQTANAASASAPAAVAPAVVAPEAPAVSSQPAEKPASVQRIDTSQPVASGGKAHASPAIRRFARELGVQIGQVKGSGEKGRVTKDDVQQFVKNALAQPRGAAGGRNNKTICFRV